MIDIFEVSIYRELAQGAERSPRCSLAGLLAVALLLSPTLAPAHIRVDPATADPGRYATLTFWLYHGCGDAPTESFTLEIPAGVIAPTPQVKAGWKIETRTQTYDPPARIYGRTVKQGFTEITWSGGNVPAHYMDHFMVTVFIAEGIDSDLEFRTVQRCIGVEEPERAPAKLRIAVPVREEPEGAQAASPDGRKAP